MAINTQVTKPPISRAVKFMQHAKATQDGPDVWVANYNIVRDYGHNQQFATHSPGAAGFLIAAGFSMSANYYVFAVPMALGGLISYWL